VLARYAGIGHGDIRPAHGAVLRNVERQGTTLAGLARRAGMTHRAMAKLVQDLEQLGYVERVAAQADGRATLVRYSRRGQRLLRDSRAVIDAIYRTYARRVGAGQPHLLEAQLARLLGALDSSQSAGGRGARAMAPERSARDQPGEHLSRMLGRYLAEMASDYHHRCARRMAACGHGGIRFDHLAVLSHLDVAGMDLSSLAARAGITLQAMGKQVRAVHRLGYVACEADPGDRRVRRVSFTARGLQFIEDLLATFDDIEADYAGLIGVRALRSLQRRLEQFAARLDLRVPARHSSARRQALPDA